MFSSPGAGGAVELDCDRSANRLGPAFSLMSPILERSFMELLLYVHDAHQGLSSAVLSKAFF